MATHGKDLVPVTEIAQVELKLKAVGEEIDALKKKAAEIAAEAFAVLDRVAEMPVETYAEYEAAGRALREMKGGMQLVDARVGPLVSAAHQTHKAAKSIETAFKGPMEKLLGVVKMKMRAVIVREEIRGASPLEEIGLDQEKLAAAYALAEDGKQEEAEALLAEAGVFTPDELPEGLPKIDGVSIRTEWSWKVIDENKIQREYLMPDKKKIGGVVRAMHDKTKIKGITVYSFPNLAISAK
jgi:hypothetical protein